MLQISKYTPDFGYYIFKKANKIRQFIGLPQKTEYLLLAKNENVDIAQINKEKYWRIPQKAASFNYVSIGKKFDSDFCREVISFFDENGKLIQKLFRENGKNIKQRIYKYDDEKRTIEQRIFDTSRISDEIQDINVRNMWGMWKKEFTEQQWIMKLKNSFTSNGKQATFLKTKRSTYLNDDETIKKVTFTEFSPNSIPHNIRKNIKVLGIIEQRQNMIKVNNIETECITLDKDDKYLPLRFLDLHTPEGLTVLTKYYIGKKGLKPLNIHIIPNSDNVASNSNASFSPSSREIKFSPNVVKQYILDIIDTVAHEVEHAYQHCQIGRLGKGHNDYEFDAFKKFGEIENFEEREEAYKYVIARENYPKFTDDEDLSKNLAYKNNYLEVKARLAGARAADNFEKAKTNFEFFSQFE